MEIIRLTAVQAGACWEIPVLYEDEDVLAVNKPASFLTSPDRYDPARPNLMRLLHEAIEKRASWAAQRNISYLMNAHRLDFETSGVLLLARNKPALVALANLFGSQKPVKKYAAVVHGSSPTREFQVDAKLAPHPTIPGLIRVDSKNGKASVTDFAVRETFSGYMLMDCSPRTGRTHQIRVHLKTAGFPIVGDSLYGGKELLLSNLKPHYRLKPGRTEIPLLQRAALHAESIEFPHPITGVTTKVEAPWAKDMTVAVKYLRRHAPAPSY